MKKLTYAQLEKKIKDGTIEMLSDLMGSYRNIAQVRTISNKTVSYELTGTITEFFNKVK